LAETAGLPAPARTSSRSGHCPRLRRIHASDRLSLEGNLYGRSLSASAQPHRFLPGAKGGLYCWEQVRRCSEVILVEGLFDYAVLWLDAFGGEAIGIALSVAFEQSMTLEFAEIVTKLIQTVGLLRKAKGGEDRGVNLFGSPAADDAAAVEKNLEQPDHPRLMDFEARIANLS
jgi:hypothetical protein